jgi:hypothetical protein
MQLFAKERAPIEARRSYPIESGKSDVRALGQTIHRPWYFGSLIEALEAVPIVKVHSMRL